MNYKSKCEKCDKVFDRGSDGRPYKSQSAADQALRMHVARLHEKTIINTRNRATRPQLELVGKNGSGAGSVIASFDEPTHSANNKLTAEQQSSIISFIQNRHGDFSSKKMCFDAALAANNAVGVIQNNGSAVERYYAKAGIKPTRKNKKAAASAKPHVHAPAQVPVAYKTINFCEVCGNNLKAQALASVIASRLAAGAIVLVDGKKVEYAS